MDTETKDIIQVATWTIGAAGGLVAAFRAVHEMMRSREQRTVDHLWRQAREARSLVDGLREDHLARDAMTMLDWSGREYQTSKGVAVRITHEEMHRGLRTTSLSFDAKEVHTRDCFDHFLDHLERINWSVEIGLTRESDVLDPLRYYIARMASEKDVFEAFMEHYEFRGALALVRRCHEWADA